MPSIEEHEDWLRHSPCMICIQWPVALHHPYGGSMVARGIMKSSNEKVSDWLQLPICYDHHQGNEGIHTLGVKAWERKYEEQSDLVDFLCEMSGLDLWELANKDKPSKLTRNN